MRFIVSTWWQEAGKDPEPHHYGFFSFEKSAEHVGEMLTKPGGTEEHRLYEVREVISPGPSSLSEWLLKVRAEIEHQYGAYYSVDADKFYDYGLNAGFEDDAANAAYDGAKIAMQLLEVQ